MYDVLPLLVVLFQLDKTPRHNHPDATYACQHPHNPEEGKAKQRNGEQKRKELTNVTCDFECLVSIAKHCHVL